MASILLRQPIRWSDMKRIGVKEPKHFRITENGTHYDSRQGLLSGETLTVEESQCSDHKSISETKELSLSQRTTVSSVLTNKISDHHKHRVCGQRTV